MWAAHLLYHLATSFDTAWPAAQRAATGSITSMAMMSSPVWLTPAQILLLDAGLLLTLYVVWRVARQYSGKIATAAALVAPWAVLSGALYATGIWILFQPMQMRGMLH